MCRGGFHGIAIFDRSGKVGQSNPSNFNLNSLALQIRHHDMLQTEIEMHSVLVPKIETKTKKIVIL